MPEHPWVLLTDQATGLSYYANTETKETTWEVPAELGGSEGMACPYVRLELCGVRKARSSGCAMATTCLWLWDPDRKVHNHSSLSPGLTGLQFSKGGQNRAVQIPHGRPGRRS